MSTELTERASQTHFARISEASLAAWSKAAELCARPPEAVAHADVASDRGLALWLHGACMLIVAGGALAGIAWLAHKINTSWVLL